MPKYEDFVGAQEKHGDDYFDGSEFALRDELEATQYWHVHRRRVLLESLLSLELPKESRLLELGCGIGTVATHLNAGGLQVDYADVFEAALNIAMKRASERLGPEAEKRRFIRLDVTQPLPISGYEGLLLFDVLEHLPNDKEVLGHLRDALPQEGLLFLTVPAFPFLWSPWDEIEKHKRRYTKTSLVPLLEEAGFRVDHVTYFFFPLFFAASAVKGLRSARKLFGAPKKAQDITELTEAKSSPMLNRVMLSVLSGERPLLKHLRLPMGTSLMAVARRR